MKLLARLLLATLVLGLIAAPAGAKELTRATVCGASGCTTIEDDHQNLMAFADTPYPSDTPPPAPFLTVTLFVDAGDGKRHSWTVDYVPSAGLIRTGGEFGESEWYELGYDPNVEFGIRLEKVTPFPAGAFDEMLDSAPGAFTRADFKKLPGGSLAVPIVPDTDTATAPKSAPAAPARRDDSSTLPWIVVGTLALLATVGTGLIVRRRTTRAVA